jgi:hypothetical protein
MMKLCGNSTRYFALSIAILLTFSNDSWAKYSVLLIHPDATRDYLSNDTHIKQPAPDITVWNRLLNIDHYQLDVKPESRLLKRLNSYAMIILPEALCLSTDMLKALRDYLEDGGGLLLTGETGSRDNDGVWRGYDFLESVLGAIPRKGDRNIEHSSGILLRREVVGSMALPPGFSLELMKSDTILFLSETDSVEVGGFYSDSVKSKMVGYAVKKLPSRGRLVWFGGNLNSIYKDSVMREQIQPMFDQLFHWLSGEHVVSPEPWHSGIKSAVLIHGDITDNFADIDKFVNMFERLEVNTTYSVVTDYITPYPELIESMIESGGEIALIGNNEDRFSGQLFETQIRRLKTGMDELSSFNKRIFGFRPPNSAYNGNSISALEQLEFKYVLADHHPVGRYPRHVPSGLSKHGIVFFPNIEDNFEETHETGGFFGFNYTSKSVSVSKYLEEIEATVTKIKNDSTVWIATGDSIARWIKQRNQFSVTAKRIDNKFKITSFNNGNEPITGVVLRVISPILNPKLKITSSSEECLFVDMGSYYLLHLPSIEPNDEFNTVLNWDGKIPLREAVPVILEWFLYGVLVLAIFFIGWSVIYFAFSKGKVKVQVAGNSVGKLPKKPQTAGSYNTSKPNQQPRATKNQPSVQTRSTTKKVSKIRTTVGWKLPEQKDSIQDKSGSQDISQKPSNIEDWK